MGTGYTALLRWLLILLAASLPACSLAQSRFASGRTGTPGSKSGAIRAAQAQALVQKSQEAHRAGNHAEAQRLWNQAQKLVPELVKPGWLTKPPPHKAPSPPVEIIDEVLAQVASLPFIEAKPVLEEWLRRYPANRRLRKYFAQRIKAAADESHALRSPSTTTVHSKVTWWKYGMLALLTLAVFWQLHVVVSEWLRAKQDGSQKRPRPR